MDEAIDEVAGPHRRIVLGVTGGIAAYKAADLLRRLSERGHEVTVVPTAAALEFVGEATWAALSHRPVVADVWAGAHDIPHVRLGREADLVVVAPATADLLARAAHGIADDLLTNTLLTARCPVLFVPAMHTEMWEHPATADNVTTLRRRGAVVLEPAVGRLAGADTGKGRLPEPVEIAQLAEVLLIRADALPANLAGRRVVVSAGGTREPLDPVRFLGNASSGKQGYALEQRGRRARRTRHAGRGQLRLRRTRRARTSCMSEAPLSYATRCSRRPGRPTRSSWQPRWPTSGRRPSPRIRSRSWQSDPAPVALERTPDVLASWSAAAVRGRYWSGSPPRRATPRATCWRTAARSWPARDAT